MTTLVERVARAIARNPDWIVPGHTLGGPSIKVWESLSPIARTALAEVAAWLEENDRGGGCQTVSAEDIRAELTQPAAGIGERSSAGSGK